MVLGAVVPALIERRRGFRLGQYGMAGGTVCPRCTFPYSRVVLAPNLVVGKLSRCPHCGKWTIARAASAENLQQAEARYVGERPEREDPDPVRERQRMIDESRYVK